MKTIFALLLSLFITTSYAHHSPDHQAFVAGEMGMGNTIMCDTANHVRSLILAKNLEGEERFKALFVEYFNTKNSLGEHTCIAGKLKFIVYEKVFEYQEETQKVYVLKVGVPQRNGKVFEYYIASQWDVEGDHFKNMKYCVPSTICIPA